MPDSRDWELPFRPLAGILRRRLAGTGFSTSGLSVKSVVIGLSDSFRMLMAASVAEPACFTANSRFDGTIIPFASDTASEKESKRPFPVGSGLSD